VEIHEIEYNFYGRETRQMNFLRRAREMGIKAGINGFGRIGRLALRAGIERGDVDFVALNAPDKTPEQLAYLFKYDSVHGRFEGDVTFDEQHLIINGKPTIVFDSRNPADLPWGDYGADYVLECTGRFLTREAVQPHLDNGAKVVVISAPPKDDTPLFVMGVNHNTYTPDLNVVSNASCTTNCLAPLAKIIHEHFGIEEGLMTTVHAVTASEAAVDGFNKKNWRLGRTAFDNIIPTSTGAAKAVGKVIPALKGKLTGTSLRVPVPDVSVVDLTVRLTTPVSYEEICQVMKQAAESEYRGIVGYVDEHVVSTDFKTDARTCIFDVKAGVALSDNFVKLIAWYDNEWGYSNKLLDLAKHVHSVRCPEAEDIAIAV
jgi:glyceraldehyde 3-phosphate dehydrogenase